MSWRGTRSAQAPPATLVRQPNQSHVTVLTVPALDEVPCPRGVTRPDFALQCQLPIRTSRGLGCPVPVSTYAFKLIRNEPHLVLQCDMKGTAYRCARTWHRSATSESDNRDAIGSAYMDSLITAAAARLTVGDPLGALNLIALRDDAAGLARIGL